MDPALLRFVLLLALFAAACTSAPGGGSGSALKTDAQAAADLGTELTVVEETSEENDELVADTEEDVGDAAAIEIAGQIKDIAALADQTPAIEDVKASNDAAAEVSDAADVKSVADVIDATPDVAPIEDLKAETEIAQPPDVEPADVPPDVPAVPPLGGKPGAGCPGVEGADACSADGKLRVQCIFGAWTTLQHCGFGLCKAVYTAGGAVLTTCGTPKVSYPDISRACSRYFKCFGNVVDHETCVRANMHPEQFAKGQPYGQKVPVVELAYAEMYKSPVCASKAETCASLAECIHFFPNEMCAGPTQGCSGDVAWNCNAGGKALAVGCKAYGQTCAMVSGVATCANVGKCVAPAVSLCDEQTSTACVGIDAGKVIELAASCEATGKSCVPGSPSTNCTGATITPCDVAKTPGACFKNKAVNCVGGSSIAESCPAATSCVLLDQFNLMAPTCPASDGCALALCSESVQCAMQAKCVGTQVWFCENGLPAIFDCKDLGMSCASGGKGPHCQ